MDEKTLNGGIEQLDYSITVKGGKYKDHYKTLLNWFKRGFFNGGNDNGSRGKGISNDGPRVQPKEYTGDDLPSEAERIRGLQQLKEIKRLARGIG